MMHRLLGTLALVAVAGCSADAPSAGDSSLSDRTPNQGSGIVAGDLEVTVNQADKTLILRNTTEHVVGYMVVEKNMAVVAMFPPCGDNCEKIVQGASDTVSFNDIAGYTPEATEANVMWFTYAQAQDGTLTPLGSMRGSVVRLD